MMDFRIVDPDKTNFDVTIGVASTSPIGPNLNERRIDNALQAVNGMNLTKRRLTPAQIAKL
jgi:hypothetical protein